HLLVFDRYLRQTNADWHSLQPFYFLEMRANLQMEPRGVNRVFSSVRVFFHYLLRQEYVIENPLQDIPPLKENSIIPFVLTPAQTDQLLQVVCERVGRSEKRFLIDLAIYLAVVLLARCGMRISEPTKLLNKHYRRDDKTLYIEKTKFKKERLIPLPKAVVIEMENFLAARKRLRANDENPYLLPGRKGKPLRAYQIRSMFRQAVKDIGLQQRRKIMGNMYFNPPRPHCLRHSFAINTLNEIAKRGDSPQDALPFLADYLGHNNYLCSSVYLKIADAQSRNKLYDFTIWQKWKI
ncbi:MAG: tyrosine-type recombinase/integrase, partial [Deltaproteobacteria bacterium]|nr:tyrosine-type recombinase/integrase [Deltaproteobacteria bacterium]